MHPGPLYAANIGRALIAVIRDDQESAKDLYASLSSISGVMWPQSPMGPEISTDRILGLLSYTIGELDRSEGHFKAAQNFCRNAGYRPELAWVCYEYASALSARNTVGDQATASLLLDESLAISTELNMRPLMERILAKREILKA